MNHSKPIREATYILDLRASKSGKGVGAIRGRHQSCLAEVIFCLKVPYLCLVGPVDDTNRDREDGVALQEH